MFMILDYKTGGLKKTISSRFKKKKSQYKIQMQIKIFFRYIPTKSQRVPCLSASGKFNIQFAVVKINLLLTMQSAVI